jgi:hypothetical protein
MDSVIKVNPQLHYERRLDLAALIVATAHCKSLTSLSAPPLVSKLVYPICVGPRLRSS